MLHALLATIGTLAMLVSIVVKLAARRADAVEGGVPGPWSARSDRPCHRRRRAAVPGQVAGRCAADPARGGQGLRHQDLVGGKAEGKLVVSVG